MFMISSHLVEILIFENIFNLEGTIIPARYESSILPLFLHLLAGHEHSEDNNDGHQGQDGQDDAGQVAHHPTLFALGGHRSRILLASEWKVVRDESRLGSPRPHGSHPPRGVVVGESGVV